MSYVFVCVFVSLIAAASVIASKDVLMKVNDDPGDIKWANCNNDASMMIKSLDVTPKHIKLGDAVTVSASVQVTRDIIAPVKFKASVQMEQGKQVWIEMCDVVPTDYCQQDDVCVVLKELSQVYPCPKLITEQGSNCQCPAKAKTYSVTRLQYKLPKLQIELSGRFKAEFNFTQSPNTVVGCVKLDFCLGPCTHN